MDCKNCAISYFFPPQKTKPLFLFMPHKETLFRMHIIGLLAVYNCYIN